MKKTLAHILLLICFYSFSFAQTVSQITSNIKKVTVFTQGAQIERETSISLKKGQTTIKLTGLSSYINKESIRLDGDGSYTILTVQHQNDYLNELDKNEEAKSLLKDIKKLELEIENEEIWLEITTEKLSFLKTNKNISGKEENISPENYKAFNLIYGNNIEKLNLDILKRERVINNHKSEIKKLKKQRNSLNNDVDLPSGTILVTINSNEVKNATLNFNYLVENASWTPSYDARYLSLNKPLNITYKANIIQNTGVDWKNINMTLSTAKTNVSANIPELNPFYLNYYYPRVDNILRGRVSGVQIQKTEGIQIRGAASVTDSSNPLIIVDGIPLGTDSDILKGIDPDNINTIDVLKDASSTAIYGSRGANGVILVSLKNSNNKKRKTSTPLTITSKNETSNEYVVKTPQTILSNNKTATISFRKKELEADFEYQSIPKLSENVFLIGKIKDWYKAELLNGEVNIYLEDSYVGKSIINTQQFKDELEISFGIDNNISIKREKLSKFSKSKFIGSNRKETVAYKLTLRNNKSYAVTSKVFDQIPISNTKDIQVEILETSEGKLNSISGELEWDIALNSNETKELIIKYSVKYPKNKKVIVK